MGDTLRDTANRRVLSSGASGYGAAMSYTLIRRDDPSVETFRDAFFKMRRALGVTAFGLNEVVIPAGGSGIEHDEVATDHEEVYVVLEGAGTATIDGEPVAIREGDYLRVPPEATRLMEAGDDGLRFLAIGARVQDAYDGRERL